MAYLAFFWCVVGIAALMIRWRPAAAVGVFLSTYAFEQWLQGSSTYFIEHHTLANYVNVGLLAFAVIVTIARHRGAAFRQTGAFALSMLLFALSLFSVVWSHYPDGTIAAWREQWPYVVAALVMAPLVIVRPDDLRTALTSTMLAGAGVLSLLLFTSALTGRSVEFTATIHVHGLEKEKGNPLAIGSLAGYVVLAGTLMNFTGVARVWQVLRWLIVAVALAVGVQSGSRGQLLAMIAAAVAFLPLSRRVKSVTGFLGTTAGLVMVGALTYWAFTSFSHNQGLRWQADEMIKDVREGRLDPSLQLMDYWASQGPVAWLIGVGSSASYHPKIIGFYPHVVPVEVLCEEGLIGFTLFSAVVVLTLLALWRCAHDVADDPVRRGLLAAIGALFLFELLLSMKQGSLLGNTTVFAFAVMVGRYAREIREARSNRTEMTDYLGGEPSYDSASAASPSVY